MRSIFTIFFRFLGAVVFQALILGSSLVLGQEKKLLDPSISPHVERPSSFAPRRNIILHPMYVQPSSNQAAFKEFRDIIAKYEEKFESREEGLLYKTCEELAPALKQQLKADVERIAQKAANKAEYEKEVRALAEKNAKKLEDFIAKRSTQFSKDPYRVEYDPKTKKGTYPSEQSDFMKALDTHEKRVEFFVRLQMNTVQDAVQLKNNPIEFEDYFLKEECLVHRFKMAERVPVKALKDFLSKSSAAINKLRKGIDSVVPKIDRELKVLEEKAKKGTLVAEEGKRLDELMGDYFRLVALRGHLAIAGEKRDAEETKAQVARIDERIAQLEKQKDGDLKTALKTAMTLRVLKRDLTTEGNLYSVEFLRGREVMMAKFLQLWKEWPTEKNNHKSVHEIFAPDPPRQYSPFTEDRLMSANHLADAFTQLLQRSAYYVVMTEDRYHSLGLQPPPPDAPPKVVQTLQEERRARIREKYADYTGKKQ